MDDIDATVAELRHRGVAFEEVDLPGLAVVVEAEKLLVARSSSEESSVLLCRAVPESDHRRKVMGEQHYEHLIFERTGAVSTITLNRPEVHNALDRKLSDELNAAVRVVRADRDCRVLVLRGAGDTFCAGDDITDFNSWQPDDPYWQVRLYQETVQIIEDLTPITIAAVDGVCTGGGLELTLVCDFVIATDRSRWGMPEIDWDITPGWGGTSRLARIAGRRKAKEWNLIGALFDASTAERYDLVNRICAPEELVEEVDALTQVMLAKHPLTVRRTKFILNQGADVHVSGALAFEVPVQPFPTDRQGIRDFTDREARERRRSLSKNFWQNGSSARRQSAEASPT